MQREDLLLRVDSWAGRAYIITFIVLVMVLLNAIFQWGVVEPFSTESVSENTEEWRTGR